MDSEKPQRDLYIVDPEALEVLEDAQAQAFKAQVSRAQAKTLKAINIPTGTPTDSTAFTARAAQMAAPRPTIDDLAPKIDDSDQTLPEPTVEASAAVAAATSLESSNGTDQTTMDLDDVVVATPASDTKDFEFEVASETGDLELDDDVEIADYDETAESDESEASEYETSEDTVEAEADETTNPQAELESESVIEAEGTVEAEDELYVDTQDTADEGTDSADEIDAATEVDSSEPFEFDEEPELEETSDVQDDLEEVEALSEPSVEAPVEASVATQASAAAQASAPEAAKPASSTNVFGSMVSAAPVIAASAPAQAAPVVNAAAAAPVAAVHAAIENSASDTVAAGAGAVSAAASTVSAAAQTAGAAAQSAAINTAASANVISSANAGAQAVSKDKPENIDKLFAEVSAEYEATQAMIKKAQANQQKDIPIEPEDDGVDFTQLTEVDDTYTEPESDEYPSNVFGIVDGEDLAGEDDTFEAAEKQKFELTAPAWLTEALGASKLSLSIPENISVIRQYAQTKRAHATALDELTAAEQNANTLTDNLKHRRDVEANYDEIVQTQQAELEEASTALAEATKEKELHEKHHEQGLEYLNNLKATNEQEIAPYLELAENSKNALDDAERIYQDAAHSLQIATAQANDAINSHDIQISNANSTIERAVAKVTQLQDEYDALKQNPDTTATDLNNKNAEVSRALAQLENARAKALQIEQETSYEIDNAQALLSNQQRFFSDSELTLRSAQASEQMKRERYITMRSDADAQEQDIAERVQEIIGDIKQAMLRQTEAQKRVDVAQAALDDANDIHANPDVTEELASTVEGAQQIYQNKLDEVNQLEEAKTDLAALAKNSYLVLGGFAALVIIVVIFIIWLIIR